MELAQESIEIDHHTSFKFRLDCDDIAGYIRLTKYIKGKNGKTRMTRRNLPIDNAKKERFYRMRSGWYDAKLGDPFTGSYISRSEDADNYNMWKAFMCDLYKRRKAWSDIK